MLPGLSIVHVTAPARFGGLESVVTALGAGQMERGDRVVVVAVLEPAEDPAGHPFLQALRGEGVPVEVFRVPARGYLRERRLLRDLLRRVEPDVVHTHGFRPDVVDAGVARRLGIPAVATVHGFSRSPHLRMRIYEALQLRALRRFDAVVPVSRILAEELEEAGVPRDRLHLHPNAWRPGGDGLAGPAAREALSLGEAGFHLGWIGRLSREKAPDVLVEALGRLGDLPWTASFVGEGPMRAPLRQRVRELGLAERVRWHGTVPGAARYLAAFDLVVLSSRTEGTPIVLLEAMSASRPVVATRVGGVPDLVDGAARLVDPEEPEALAAAIRELHRDAGLREELGRAAHRRLEVWADMDRWVGGYRRIYEHASHASRGGGASR